MGFTNEEIKSGSINIFDHLEKPESRLDAICCLRLLQYLPLMEQSIYDRLCELMEDKNLFKHMIKYKLKQIGKLIDAVATQVYREMKIDRNDVPTDLFFGLDMADNLTNAFIEYMEIIEVLTNVDKTESEESRIDRIFNKAKMLCQLHQGDRFIFIDQANAVEYTFSHYTVGEHADNETDITVYYKKVSSDVTFTERDIFRPVIVSNLINEDVISHVKELINNKLHFNG